jgi:hypothetical protein
VILVLQLNDDVAERRLSASVPITPRFSVTSATRSSPVNLIGLFSLALPVRYSMTSTARLIALIS